MCGSCAFIYLVSVVLYGGGGYSLGGGHAWSGGLGACSRLEWCFGGLFLVGVVV